MKVLITGSDGQLGKALQEWRPQGIQVTAMDWQELDIGDRDAVDTLMTQKAPALVINAAAYTAVDRAESEADLAYRVNGEGPSHLAAACARIGARFIHVSTDFIFDGTSASPIVPSHVPSPLSVYGASKLAGEQAVHRIIPDALIVRTAWVYGVTGHNFVRTMLRLMADRDELSVVADQVGTPTFADGLARTIWTLHAAGATGIHHWTDSGVASWYDFAVAIQEEAIAIGLLSRQIPILPIATSDYPTPARRPLYSVLDKSATVAVIGGPAPHWRVNLREMLERIKGS